MIGPEQSKKASGKAGKKKGKAKKAKRLAAELELGDAPGPASPVPASTVPEVGPLLLTWIDRVQERVDHLLTLVEPAPTPAAEPEAADPVPSAPAESVASAAEPDPNGESASTLAEAWSQRQQTAPAPSPDEVTSLSEAPPLDDDELFDTRLTAVLVARELIARGESPVDVRRRLRDGYGVVDPDAVLAQIAA